MREQFITANLQNKVKGYPPSDHIHLLPEFTLKPLNRRSVVQRRAINPQNIVIDRLTSSRYAYIIRLW